HAYRIGAGMRFNMLPVDRLSRFGGSVSLHAIGRFESGFGLRLLRKRGREPRDAAEERLEEVGRSRRRIGAFGVIAGYEIAGPAACARLQIGKIGLHARDLPVDLAALRRRIRAEKQELAILAAKRARITLSARQFGALTLDRGLRAAGAVARGDRLL